MWMVGVLYVAPWNFRRVEDGVVFVLEDEVLDGNVSLRIELSKDGPDSVVRNAW